MQLTAISILLVEDNPGDVVLFTDYLSSTGISLSSLDVAGTLESALQRIESKAYDLVFIDLHLPDSRGIETFNTLKLKKPELAVIVLSGIDDEELGGDAVKQGALDYLVKVNLSSLILKKTIFYALERKVYVNSLRESERKYKYLFEYNPIPMWITDRQTHCFLDVNHAAIEKYGYSREEFIGKSSFDIRPASERKALQEYFENTVEGNGFLNAGEWNHYLKSGELITVSIFSNRIEYDGRDARLVALYDVTERNEAKKQLQQSEALFRLLAENIPNGAIFLLDKNFQVLFTSGMEYHKLDINPDEFKNQHILHILSKNKSAKTIENKLATLRKKGLVNFEMTWDDQKYLVNASKIHGLSGHQYILTAQNISELSIAQEETRFQAEVLMNINDSVIVTDFDGKVLYWNDGAKNLFGYTENEMLGQSIAIIYPKNGKKVAYKIFEQGNTFEGEWKGINKKEKEVWVQVKTSVMRDHNGMPIGVLGISRDITEKKKEEEKLRLYESVITNANDAVVITEAGELNHPGPRIIYINEAFSKMTGYEPAEVLGQTPRILQGPDTDRHTLDFIRRQLEKWSPVDVDIKNYKKSGEAFWVNLSIVPVSNKEGIYTHWVSVQRDISERIKAQQDILKYTDRLNDILGSIANAFIAVNNDLEILGLNGLSENLFEVDSKNVLYSPVTNLFGKKDWKVISKILSNALKYKKTQRFEFLFSDKKLWYEVSVFPTKEGLSIFLQDIGERKRIENEQQLLTEELMAHNYELQQFSYIVSHNLRAPVVNIRSFYDLLELSKIKDDWNKEILDKLNTSVRRLEEILKDLVQVISLKKDAILPREKIVLQELMKMVMDSIRFQLSEANAEVTLKFSEVEEIEYVKSHLENVFLNLCTNAIKYRKSDIPLRLKVSSYQEEDYTLITFEDNGLGIDLDRYADRIFGLYQRFHENLAEGKGIGLYLVNNQLKALGGKLEVESKVGKGSVFKVFLKNQSSNGKNLDH
jgi:PAS domain S-box-containing protein